MLGRKIMFIVYSFCKTISKKLFQRIPVMVTANLKKNPISNLSKTPQHSYDKETLHCTWLHNTNYANLYMLVSYHV